MKLRILYILFLLFILESCVQNDFKKINQIEEKNYYESKGFALIYEDDLFNNKIVDKKIDNNDIFVMHAFLKKRTPIRLTNPTNSKFIETIVHKNADFPKIFNIVISKKIAADLDIDSENPYIEIFEFKKNKKFIAKEGSMFEEEKNVANKAPVGKIKMNNLKPDNDYTEAKTNKKDKFILVISDFYYLNSANNLKNELIKKISLKNISVKEITKNKYRLSVGPFKNFNALKKTYISLNNLGFESLNVYRE